MPTFGLSCTAHTNNVGWPVHPLDGRGRGYHNDCSATCGDLLAQQGSVNKNANETGKTLKLVPGAGTTPGTVPGTGTIPETLPMPAGNPKPQTRPSDGTKAGTVLVTCPKTDVDNVQDGPSIEPLWTSGAVPGRDPGAGGAWCRERDPGPGTGVGRKPVPVPGRGR